MLCYRCGHTLGAGRYCLRCGADVTLYRRIVRLSNRYYNRGLEKARVRDLTGAAEDLSRALEIDKHNISARNLLGLVLYEMGETVQALCEWVVSTNYQPEDNPASRYVKHLQDNRAELDEANQGIRKYNFALDYAKKGSEDLAIIQLEWVTAHHPKMLKAHSLLALLYHSEGMYAKAEKEVRTVLKADVGNTFCLHLQKEMEKDIRVPQTPARRRTSLGEKSRTALRRAGEESDKVRTALEGRPGFLLKILLTALILLCVLAGILVPTLERRRARAVSEAVARYSAGLEGVRSRLTDADSLKEAYGVFLEMYEMDPSDPRTLPRLHELYDSLSADRSADELYVRLYESWDAYLQQLDEAAAKPTETEPPTEESTEPETDENGEPVTETEPDETAA